jgi:hypothetical protein
MATSLDRRIAALEAKAAPVEGLFKLIVVQVVSPCGRKPVNHFCEIDGVHYERSADESPAEFEERMQSIAHELNERSGRVIRMIVSETDLDL